MGLALRDVLPRVPGLGHVGVEFQYRHRCAALVTVQRPVAGHDHARSVAMMVDQLALPGPTGYQGGLDFLPGNRKLGTQEVVAVAPYRLMRAPAVEGTEPVGPEQDLAIEPPYHGRYRVQRMHEFLQLRRLREQPRFHPLLRGN